MVAEVLSATFLSELENYKLLSLARLEEARRLRGDRGLDAKSLAAELIRRDWLTPFQVNQLLQGRGHSLTLGPYVLVERLGQGGMGEVFKARHALMDRLVALKVLRADRLDQPESLSRFRREMQAAAKLAHPNVVLAHDAGLVGDVCFLAMEYVAGIDLARLLKQRGRLPPDQACDYLRQAALGLQHAHERGLVHRDVKPSNLILATPENVVKVLDLGLARLRTSLEGNAASAALTREGAVMGTPDYIAPEQAVDAGTADIRADVYSLGCTLYHLLAGQPPFPGGSLTEKLLRHQQAEPEGLERLVAEVPPGLAGVVRQMMAKRPTDRYQIPREVADALAPFAANAAEHAAPAHAVSAGTEVATLDWLPAATPTVSDRKGLPSTPPRRIRALLLAAVAVGLTVALTVLIGVPLILLQFAGKRPTDTTEPPRTRHDVTGPEGFAAVEVANLARMPADGPAHLIKDLKGHTGIVQCLAFSGDGKWLASGGDDNQVRLWDGLTGEGQGVPLQHTDPVRALAFSPDGKRLAAASYGGDYEVTINLWDLAAPRKPRTLPWEARTGTPSRAAVRALAFSPDGKRLAAGGGPLLLWNLDKGGAPVERNWQKIFPSYLYGVAFSPDGKTVAAGCHEGGDGVRLWEVDTAREPLYLQGKKEAFGLSHSDIRAVVAYGAGGKTLIRVTSEGRDGFQSPSATVMIWDVEAEQQRIIPRDTFKIPGGAVFALASAADGHLRVAVAAGIPGLGEPASPSPPGEVQVWDGATRKVRTLRTGHKQSVTALAFSPDGSRLATGSADQSAKLWDLSR